MEGYLRSQQRRELLAALGVNEVHGVEILHSWRLSQVDRLHLPGGETVIFKTALAPFTGEAEMLRALHVHGLPVPVVRAAHVVDDMLGMLLHDLGAPAREPGLVDAAYAAVQIHRTPMTTPRPVLDEAALAALPAEGREFLDRIQASGRYPHTHYLRELLLDLAGLSRTRARDAHLEPFGLIHGELHPTAVHIGASGTWHVLDFAMSLTGPGLLDLAAWSGLRNPPDLAETRRLIERYVEAGGHPDALADRGGLPAEAWALGWHRLQAAHWLLGCTAAGINDPTTDERHIKVLHRQLAGARALLDP